MRLDKLTTKFQDALAEAQSLAVGRDHQFIEPLHIAYCLLAQQGGTVQPLLQQCQVDVLELKQLLQTRLEQLPRIQGHGGEIHISNDSIRVFNLADKAAQIRQDAYISSELFILAALEDKGSLGDLLRQVGLNKEKLTAAIEQVRGGQSVQDASAEDQRQALDKYTIDLTQRAIDGKLDPVIGRDDEIRRTVQVL
jgi:ATP-dependent Clp protease ATP-binding subunit ClpB